MVLTASGEVQTCEEAQVFVHDLDLFVTLQLLEQTPAVLSLGKPCEDHGYFYEWVSGQKPRSTKHGKTITCKTNNIVPPVVVGLPTNSGSVSSSTSPPQDSSRREVETATGNSVQTASSSSSGPVLERSDGIAPGNWCGPPKTPNPSQRPKLRGLRANQNDKGSLWRSTSSRKRWWFDSRSQSP